ncbi:MAG: hypothetical protein ACRYGF_10515 [Janthinobacterium lividum]
MKVRRSKAADEDSSPYGLQITSEHTVAGSGSPFAEEVRYSTLPELLRALSDLRLPADLLSNAKATIELEKAEDRWLLVANNVQVPFEVLTATGFSLRKPSY